MTEQQHQATELPEEEKPALWRNDPFLFNPGCDHDPNQDWAGRPDAKYALTGQQVEPEAGYWGQGPEPLPRVVPIEDVLDLTIRDAGSPFFVRPYADYQSFYDAEIAELSYLESHRNVALEQVADFSYTPGYYFGENPNDDPVKYRYLPVSDFIQLHSPPFGAVFNIRDHYQYIVQNVNQQHQRRDLHNSADPATAVVSRGRELARLSEIETPGLLHRHALNYLFYKRPQISPPRQARVWMALDIVIYSALVAAWHFKWAAPENYSYRQRPYEYDRNCNFRVLFDDVVDDAGDKDQCARTCPCPSPGTPRHPAYPSGHSTFSSAASEILKYFFRDDDTKLQLDRLANNIGTARLWAGVHWRSDHIAGVQVGRAVAHLLIRQLERDCIAPFDAKEPCDPQIPACDPADETLPLPHDQLERQALARRHAGQCDPCQDALPTQRRDGFPDCQKSFGTF